MLTRRKVHNVSDGANCQDGEDKADDEEEMNDENSSEEKDSSSHSSKERRSERKPFRSNSALQMKLTPSADRANMSPILVRKRFLFYEVNCRIYEVYIDTSRVVNVHQDPPLEEASLSLMFLQRILHCRKDKS
jgi:hypothetical protein